MGLFRKSEIKSEIDYLESAMRAYVFGDFTGLLRNRRGDYVESALTTYLSRIGRFAETQFEHDLWGSWGLGAYSLYTGLVKIPAFKKIHAFQTTPDGLDKATLLEPVSKVGSMW